MFGASGPVSANEDCFRAIFIARDGEDSLEVTPAERDTDAATSMRNRMRFNPAAIAAVGIGSKYVHDDEFESESDGETFVASHNCARWPRLMIADDAPADNEWLPALECEPWTLRANGAGPDASAEINGHRNDWNAIFSRSSLARARASRNRPVERAIDVPDESFFEIAEDLVPSLDALYFNQDGSRDLILSCAQ